MLNFHSIFTLNGLNVSVCGCILLDLVSLWLALGFVVASYYID